MATVLRYNGVILYSESALSSIVNTRRSFLQLSAAALVAATTKTSSAQSSAAVITATGATWHIKTSRYAFTYRSDKDHIEIADDKGFTIVSGPLQPQVRITGTDGVALCLPGKPEKPTVEANRLTVRYTGVNHSASLTITLRFDEDGFWLEPVTYESDQPQEIVSLHYFARPATPTATVPTSAAPPPGPDLAATVAILPSADLTPGLRASIVTVPGIAENDAVSPIQNAGVNYQRTIGLGHSGFYTPPFTHQQWGLPIHYFCMMSTQTHAIAGGRKDTYSKFRSATMVCGLADLPNGDLLLDLLDGATSPWIDYRSDLWHHLKTPGKLTLGATFAFSFGEDTLAAISAYYDRLVKASIIQRKTSSDKKNAVLAAPQYCTWGAQVVRNKIQDKLDETFIRDLYAEVKSFGMKSTLYSIDDKWEGRYGNLEHDAKRFPHFVEFLDSIRAEGHHVGLWAAFMRCEDPQELGLTPDHTLKRPDGSPYRAGGNKYYLLDFTHPEVEKVLTERARAFARTYKPAVVKFDFGYELPNVRIAAPFDKKFAGERILKKGLEIIVGALKQENPDIVVMYYQLSPLFAEFFDFHSTDDLFLAAGDYDYEANRRIYFASPLTQLGICMYGSSGYDWSSSPAIWFDSVAAGTIGSLNDFDGDEASEKQTPERIALYNGFAQTIRQGNRFDVVPFPPARPEAATRGGRSRSWARIEANKVTILAQRPPSFDEGDMNDWRRTDPRVDGLLTTSTPVVISSKTNDAVTDSTHLAIVACGDGMIQLRRNKGSLAHITTHAFGGAIKTSSIAIRNGHLVLPLKMKTVDGHPVEWTEIQITG